MDIIKKLSSLPVGTYKIFVYNDPIAKEKKIMLDLSRKEGKITIGDYPAWTIKGEDII